MPTPVISARQCLTEAAARALDEAVGVARRRSHAQTTSLHAVSALLALPSSTLRDACARARSSSYSSRLQFRALELCVGVSLDRLPSSKSTEDPPISNSLMAAIKRSQANQRRNPENYHLQQIHCNQQTASLLKVELKYFILSILDDPIVSRVFGEAGFRSCDIKLAIIHPPVTQISSKFSRPPRCPPIFLCNLTDSGLGLSSDPSRPGPSMPFGFEDVDENCRRIGEVLVKRNEKNGRNPLLVGVCASNALKGFIENVSSCKLGVLPKEIYGLDVVSIDREINMFVAESGSEEMMELRFKELENAVEQCTGPGVVINFGELKALVGDHVSNEAVNFVVSKLTSLLQTNSGKLWLIGAAANYDTYLKFSNKFPTIEKDWDLHLLPIHSKSSLMGSFVPFGGFFSSPIDFKSPTRSKNQYSNCCYLCTEKFEHEVAAILKEGSTASVTDQCSEKLPPWLQMTELDTRKVADVAKTKEDGLVLNAKVWELQKKWNDICQRLHHTQLLSKLDIPEMMSQVPVSEVFQFIADTKESSNKDPPSNENLYANPNPSLHMDLQNIVSPKQNSAIATNSEAENVNSQSKLQVNFSKNQQAENEDCPFSTYTLPNLTKPSDHPSASSPITVTTDLGLGTIYESTRPNAEMSEFKDQSLPHSRSPEFVGVCEDTSHHVGKHCSYTGTNVGEQSDPGDYKNLWKKLTEKVGWQDEVIRSISQTISRCRNGYGRRGSNCKGDIWLSFLGPDRVGKKKIASALAEIMFGNQENIIAVELSPQDRASHPESIFECRGLNGSYFGDYVAEELRKKPNAVIFIENVDKADPVAQDRLSKAIKTGKFCNSRGREISINNVIFVTTSTITKGYDSVYSERKINKYSEEMILRAKRWQIQMLISSHSEDVKRTHDLNVNVTPIEETSNAKSLNKRKLIDIGDSQKRSHKSSRSYLDLNIPIDEAEEEQNSEDYDSDAISEDTEAWLEEFFDQVDEKLVFKPCNFDALADKLVKEINKRFQQTMGSEILLEIDHEVMVQMLAAAWLSNKRRAIEGWVENVLSKSFNEFQQKHHPTSGSVVKLVASEGHIFKEQTPGLCLPTKVNI